MIFIASIGFWIFIQRNKKTTPARAQQVPLSHGAGAIFGAHIYAAREDNVMATRGSEEKNGENSCEIWHLTHVIWKNGLYTKISNLNDM